MYTLVQTRLALSLAIDPLNPLTWTVHADIREYIVYSLIMRIGLYTAVYGALTSRSGCSLL